MLLQLLFLISGRPTISTLFPYTTLFRSAGAGVPYAALTSDELEMFDAGKKEFAEEDGLAEGLGEAILDRKSTRLKLQSRQYLVCRLLLEKKNKPVIVAESATKD